MPGADGEALSGGSGDNEHGAAAPAGVHIKARGRISGSEAAGVLALARAAEEADGVAPLSEQVRLHVEDGGDPRAKNLVLWQGGRLAGFAHLGQAAPAAGRTGELVVHPAHRRRGLGLALARATVAEGGPGGVRLWAHGGLPAAARLAHAAGFRSVRELWRMHAPLGAPLDPPRLPDHVRVRTFIPGRDEQQWLALNRRAFAGHPEQGRWTSHDLARREREPWFDPAGFFLAERDGQLAGFHWTKIIQPRPGGGKTERMGEVYVLGVDPAEQGTGLGRALTLWGLRYLQDRGVARVMLYVEGDNGAAIRLYESLGFTRTDTDVMYDHPAPRP